MPIQDSHNKRLCKCGCGQEVSVRAKEGYIANHSTRNKGLRNFWSKVYKADTGCWIWLGSRTAMGYGDLQINNVKYYAHRLAYEILVGPIPKGAHLLHSCDTPLCVNPEHLFLGSQTDNIHDAIKKGRMKGTVLTDSDVQDIRAYYEQGCPQNIIAAFYGASQSHICRIVNRKKRCSV